MAFFRRKKKPEDPDMPESMVRDLREKAYYEDDSDAERDLYAGGDDGADNDRMAAIERLAASLVRKREIAVTARASCGIEAIWREDELAFEGMDEAALRTRMIDYAAENAPARMSRKEPKRSKVVINIVRPKCETAEGRFADIQLPTDDRNWGLKVTPVPELVKGLSDSRPVRLRSNGQPLETDGKPVTVGDVARSDVETAKEKMAAMEEEIDDQLTECSYKAECRKAIRNAVRLGTGIMKGPVVSKDVKRAWRRIQDGEEVAHVLSVVEEHKPTSKSVDPWDVYPDPECGEDFRKAGYIWERETISPRGLRELIGIEGYLDDQIREALNEEPAILQVAQGKETPLLVKYNRVARGSSYEKWEYNGDLDKEDLEAIGIDCSEIQDATITACVVMVNDRPIKVMLNDLDTGDLPYDFFQWTLRSGIVWGMGVTRELIWQARVIIAAWRAMMDNAGDSAGANIVIGDGIEPMDGNWEITGKKLWKALPDTNTKDVLKAFAQFQIENNQEDLQNIIELVLRFADMESGIPMFFHGEQKTMPETLGATNILVDSHNVALRARVKLWDDYVTRPHITRYYDWNMQYNEKDEIKGDYSVDPRGTSILLERDLQQQDMKEILGLREDPEIADIIDWEKVAKVLLAARNLDVILPKEKIEENRKRRAEQPAPVDPKVEGSLKVAQMRAEGDYAKAQLNQESDMAELEFKAEQAEIDRQHEERMKQIERELKMMELAITQKVSLDKIKADLARDSQKLNVQVGLAKDKNTKPAEEVIPAPTEPAGRAAEGMAFQQ